MVKVTLRGRQLVGGLYGAEKRQSEKNYFPLQKLMIMSSYLMDSNYIDPKFPPCEEYSQNNYIPDHSPEYYSRTRESSYQHHHQELYPVPRPSFPDRQFGCGGLQAPGNPAALQRGHGQTPGGQHLSEKAQQLCEQAALSTSSTTPSPAPPACGQPNPDHPTSTASKQPIVYPWMKKIHVSTGEVTLSLSEPYAGLPPATRLSGGRSERSFTTCPVA
nr:PREDICTED: homeobox protein Hox-C4-like [Opisthocomus hoazin]